MVRAGYVGSDIGVAYLRHQALRYEKIVDAPAYVLLAGASAVAPPAVGSGQTGVEFAERIGESGSEQFGESGTLLVGKSGVAAVCLGVGEVDLFVSHVEITADDNRFVRVEAAEKIAESTIPFHAVVEPCQLIL